MLLAFLFLSVGARAAERAVPVTDFYVGAHGDDIALFEYPVNDIQNRKARVVFIYTTAGDAGAGAGDVLPDGQSGPSARYLAREAGSLRFSRFLADIDASPVPDPPAETRGRILLNGHRIYLVAYRNTVNYFLRLPDGGLDGTGFATTGNVSLTKLENGSVNTLTAVDGSTTYAGWKDLVATLTAIVKYEARGSGTVTLNVQDPDIANNPGDHPDHTATGNAMLGVGANVPCANILAYVDYALANGPVDNLTTEQKETKAAGFGALITAVAEAGWPGTFNAGHMAWLTGIISRAIPGNGLACRL
jgi:hypothetical protein